MKKTVLIISGNNDGKASFINVARQDGFWLWNFSAENRLSKLSYELGWTGDRTKRYYDWLKDFKAMTNSYWDFEYKYYCNMIEKFMRSDKANVAIIHNAGDETVAKLKSKKFEGMFTFHIFDDVATSLAEGSNYDSFLVYGTETFEQEALKMLSIIKENK